jgi:hypothetical protein
LSTHAATTARSAAASETSTELFRALAALFDLELNAIDRVWVGGDGGLIRGRSLKVDKSAVL